ncbi:hypothetical protein [Cellulomonas dongxiuzhuiae]|uniref:hypothetical protein n=1 Tax=Cellulomonas dongxiuzhuiae TaxID=2819979 RepID=UPI001AAEEBF5|nr:hypothetical protein [Cellulomonas dongxiuzhuiae]MBO3088277.1 hypothetical protein [Cellulomonas dongxiuzhuiae]
MLLHDQIDMYESEAEQRVLIHEAQAQIRERFATPVAWGATATASIASLSIVSEKEAFAGVFAVITALATTFLAAYKPAEKAAEHVKAANDYDHLKRALRGLRYDLEGALKYKYVPQQEVDPETGTSYDAGGYQFSGTDRKRLADARKRFDDLKTKWYDVRSNAPFVQLETPNVEPGHVDRHDE